ncbi:MAG: response regulator transcription factor [Ignavibacteriae bacterium]|nr:response regulator transcription factor [Ignavibacteriota bacterium]
MSLRVSIVEDDERIRESLIVLIDGAEGFRCVSAYDSAEDALSDLKLKDPDVVLMDINLPNMNGIECVRKLKTSLPKTNIIMLTVFEDNNKIFSALEAGASGYLLKRTSPDQLLNAIKEVQNGGSPMSSQIARKVVQSFHKPVEQNREIILLSEREKEVMNLLVEGFLYKEIAEKLFISVDTVHSHIRRIYEKLQVRSRTQAVVKFLKK